MSFHGCHAGAQLEHHFDTHAGVKVGLPVAKWLDPPSHGPE
jgi:hypothetical protein